MGPRLTDHVHGTIISSPPRGRPLLPRWRRNSYRTDGCDARFCLDSQGVLVLPACSVASSALLLPSVWCRAPVPSVPHLGIVSRRRSIARVRLLSVRWRRYAWRGGRHEIVVWWSAAVPCVFIGSLVGFGDLFGDELAVDDQCVDCLESN
jgi:hypothetical protein